jgi:hypothetical protein
MDILNPVELKAEPQNTKVRRDAHADPAVHRASEDFYPPDIPVGPGKIFIIREQGADLRNGCSDDGFRVHEVPSLMLYDRTVQHLGALGC